MNEHGGCVTDTRPLSRPDRQMPTSSQILSLCVGISTNPSSVTDTKPLYGHQVTMGFVTDTKPLSRLLVLGTGRPQSQILSLCTGIIANLGVASLTRPMSRPIGSANSWNRGGAVTDTKPLCRRHRGPRDRHRYQASVRASSEEIVHVSDTKPLSRHLLGPPAGHRY